MKRMTGPMLVAAGIVIVFAWLGMYLPAWLGLLPAGAWILRIAFWVLGLAAAGLVFLFLRARAKNKPAIPDDEVDAAIDSARRRLPQGVKLGKVPVLLVLGPPGGAKTTTVQRSGLDPELLAGEVERAQAVVPSTVNVWYASGVVLAEAGGRLVADEVRWAHLLERLQPSRLSAVFAGGRQAPRVAVVCMSCEELAKPGAAQTALAAAQSLRQRLVEAANLFGIRLPVYVIFTKADRLPYFTDFVRSFTREESAEVLGATLPMAPATDSGRFKEAESARLGDVFGRMLHSLSVRRLDVLPRETADEVRAGAYEFPRELGKLSGLASQFLVELCRPGQIGASPFLRGFYFTGVRPLVVSEGPQAAAPPPLAAGGGAVDATAVFDPRAMMAAAQQAAAPAHGSRRVPDWTFLPRIFKEIIFSDRVAMGVTGGGARVNLLRRAFLVAAGLALLLLSGAFLVSWLSNRGLVSEARAAMATVQGVDVSGMGMPAATDLARLDSLRSLTSRLRTWDTTAPPLRYRWGLYAGDGLLPGLRRLYFDRFGRMLWVGTRDNIVSYLSALADTPTAPGQYDTTFAALKAYIITNDHPEFSTQEFLSPVLVRHWQGQRQLEPELGGLATSQFDFFASELPFGNPYDSEDRADLVSRSRRFLAQFGDTDRLYQALINQASNNSPAVQFHRDVPGSDRVLRNPVVVPGAFTEPGWEFVRANLDNVDQFLAGDEWVLGGELRVSPADRIRLANDLRRRYIEDYIRVWTQYLAESSVLSYSGARDAANKLEMLGNNTSPMLQLFAIAARHTNVDSVNIAPAFQPVHAVVPPGTTSYIGETNEQYVAGLSDLSRAMDQAASASGPDQASAVDQAKGTADRLEGVVAQMARSFAPQGPAAQVGNAVRQLLNEPVTRLQPLIVGIPNAAVNARGASFCADATPILSKYPFRQGATNDATLEDLNQLFMPGGSALSTLVEGLQDLIIKQGNEYRARPGVQRPPSSAFLSMLNRMQRISDALYGLNPQEPTVRFLLRPQPTELATEIIVNVDGRPHRTTRQEYTAGSFEWRLVNARAASIVARNSQGRTVDELSETGSWSLFRLLGRASWAGSAGNTYRLTWNVPTAGTLSADLTMRGAPVFNPRELERLSCVRTVVGP